jgi:hypothetical protein
MALAKKQPSENDTNLTNSSGFLFPITCSGLTLDVVSNVFRSLLVETSHEHATRSVLHTLDAGLLSAP